LGFVGKPAKPFHTIEDFSFSFLLDFKEEEGTRCSNQNAERCKSLFESLTLDVLEKPW